MTRPNIFVAVLCGPERHGWHNSSLSYAFAEWAADERFDFVFDRSGFDHRTSQQARNAITQEFLKTDCSHLLMIDNDTRLDRGGQLINLPEMALLEEPRLHRIFDSQGDELISPPPKGLDIVAAAVPIIQTGALYLNAYMRQPNGKYRSRTREELRGAIQAAGQDAATGRLRSDLPPVLLECDAVGTGVICIARKVIETLANDTGDKSFGDVERICYYLKHLPATNPEGHIPVWLRLRRLDGSTELGEDLLFCERARALGFRVWTDLTRTCGHMKTLDLYEIPAFLIADKGPAEPWKHWTAEDYGLPAGTELPPLDNFSSPPGTCQLLRKLYEQVKPTMILEFGSGVSTLVLADLVRVDRKPPTFYSFENDAGVADRIQGLAKKARIFYNPVAPGGWYQTGGYFTIPEPCRILAFVDGPSTKDSGPRGRGPAMAFIDKHFPGWTGAVVLDDANREGMEALDFAEWQAAHPEATAALVAVEPGWAKRVGVLARGVELGIEAGIFTTEYAGGCVGIGSAIFATWDHWTAADYGLTDPIPPISAWSIAPGLAKWLRELVHGRKPCRIVEFGSGVSTLVLADAYREAHDDFLKIQGAGALSFPRIASFEHDLEQHKIVESCLRERPGWKWARVFLTNLGPDLFYDIGKPALKVGMVLVDGPPGSLGQCIREPAIERLRDTLVPGALIVLDDYNRPDEREIVKRWLKEWPLRVLEVRKFEDERQAVALEWERTL